VQREERGQWRQRLALAMVWAMVGFGRSAEGWSSGESGEGGEGEAQCSEDGMGMEAYEDVLVPAYDASEAMAPELLELANRLNAEPSLSNDAKAVLLHKYELADQETKVCVRSQVRRRRLRAACGALAVHQHPMVTERAGRCERELFFHQQPVDVYLRTHPPRSPWRSGSSRRRWRWSRRNP
jgi:hypothetical protein